MPYKTFTARNTNDLRYILNESESACHLLLNLLQMFSEFFTVILLYIFILYINLSMTLVLTAILILAIVFLLHSLLRKSKQYGNKRNAANFELNKAIGESFGNIKYIKLLGNESQMIKKYDAYSKITARANIMSQFLGALPKNILESIGFSLLIGAVIVILFVYKEPSTVIPIISMYALALYRILPSTNRILNNINQVTFLSKSLDIVSENINHNLIMEGNQEISFTKSISFENINFNYVENKEVLHDISFTINKGENIAIVGESGGGKSTLIDILIGIYNPNTGEIRIDDTILTKENIRAWRKKIGYIPQNIYLLDNNIADNISFGAEKKDEDRIIEVLKMANIWDFLLTKDGLNTKVGEGGIQLSGGQKQRIGIARALYNDPEVLILDEATSSLDNETEQKIMDEIYHIGKNKTLIIIAHRLSTVEHCDRKITIEKGTVTI
jgi:ATP-binding cassette subfamily B protein/ATP-binding cassette subfamily C protein